MVRRSRGFKRSRCAPTLHVCNHTQTLSNVMIMRRPSCAHSRWLHMCQIAKQGEKRPPSQPLLHTQVEGVRDQAACVRGESVCPTRLATPRGDLRRRLFAGQSSAVPGRSARARVERRQLLLGSLGSLAVARLFFWKRRYLPSVGHPWTPSVDSRHVVKYGRCKRRAGRSGPTADRDRPRQRPGSLAPTRSSC